MKYTKSIMATFPTSSKAQLINVYKRLIRAMRKQGIDIEGIKV